MLAVQVVGLPARDIEGGVIGLDGERRGEIGDGVVTKAARLVEPLEGVGDQALGGVGAAAALARGELIGRCKVARSERLGEQADGFVDVALLRGGIRRLEIVGAAGLRGCGKEHQARRRQ